MNFKDINDTLKLFDADYHAAEAQAVACGMLCINMAVDRGNWFKLLSGEDLPPESAAPGMPGLLGRLFDEVRYQLQDADLDFQLLLPDDHQPLSLRISYVQDWCRGFLLGVSIAGVKDYQSLPEDTRDLLADFAEIGTAGELEFDEHDAAGAEKSYMEIVEYVRMGVLLINEELQPLKSSPVVH